MIQNEAICRAVLRESERVREETGSEITDFLFDMGEYAEIDWTEDGYTDIESAISEVKAHADEFIDFVRRA